MNPRSENSTKTYRNIVKSNVYYEFEIILSRQLSKEQQEELNKFQQATQQLNVLQQSYIQMENTRKEIENTLETLKNKEDGVEIYRRMGQIMYKTTVKETKDKLGEDLETIKLRVSQVKKQIESFEKSLKDKEAELRASLNG